MIMHPMEPEIQKIRHEEMVREAERLAKRPNHLPMYAAALARVGEVMVEMGTSLQERYGELADNMASHRTTAENSR